MRWSLLLGLSSLLGATSCAADTEFKVPLRPDMVLDEAGRQPSGTQDGVGSLGDEQALAGDPAHGKGGTPVLSWQPGWTKWYYPAHAIIDLGAVYQLSRIYVYDGEGTGHISLAAGEPFAWQPLFTDGLPNYQQWNEHATPVRTRYLEVTLGDVGMKMPELVVYATGVEKLPGAPITPRPARPAQPPMDQMIGVNAFIDDPLATMAVAGWVREYHNWNWDEGDGHDYAGYPHNQNRWNPSAAGGGGWNFDNYYAKLKRAGMMVAPCIEGGVSWLHTGGNSLEVKPVLAGVDASLPATYAPHADHMFQYAARYGSAKVADGLLKLAPGQPRLSGLGLVHYFENWNEEDGWWRGREGWFSPYEFAAMTSADYDGHQGVLGRTVGIKNADPNAKLVMGGTAGLNLDYLKAMKLWADHYRHGSFPVDVINVHHYSNNGGEQQRGTAGISPEADHLKAKLQAFVAYRDSNLPGVEVWLTEFGYDTNPASPQHAPAIAGYAIPEVQGQWLARSYLALAAAGVDRAAMYMLRDVNAADPTQFSSSGLVAAKGSWKPKPSWYYIYTLKNRLAGMRYVGEQAAGNPHVMIYRFKRGVGGGGAYVAWCPTSDGTVESHYELPVAGTKATLVTLTDDQKDGTATPLTMQNGKVGVDVSERPVIVLTDG